MRDTAPIAGGIELGGGRLEAKESEEILPCCASKIRVDKRIGTRAAGWGQVRHRVCTPAFQSLLSSPIVSRYSLAVRYQRGHGSFLSDEMPTPVSPLPLRCFLSNARASERKLLCAWKTQPVSASQRSGPLQTRRWPLSTRVKNLDLLQG